ncbi:MAG: OmpA family protein [Flavobacteriales bacterium]
MFELKYYIRYTLGFAVFLLCNALTAQNLKLDLAENYMEAYDFQAAAEIYEDVLVKYPANYIALKNGAICHKKLQNSESSERLLLALDSLKLAKKEDLILLANAQKSNAHYEEALNTYDKYAKLYPGNELVENYTQNRDWANKINRDSSLFSMKNSDANSEFSDFAPCFYKKSVLFSSARVEAGSKAREYNWNQQAYLNLYQAELTADSSLIRPKLLEAEINSRYHEGTSSFNQLDSTLFITRNNFLKGTKKKDKEGFLNLAIYSTKEINGAFEGLIPFPFNSKEYSVGHPSVSADGTTLYFTSDMPGGLGGTDIYRTTKKEGEWTKPENLGPQVNTSGDEMFPYIHTSGVLYFSSNGHVGLGGLDLQSIDLNSEESQVQNAGFPLNSAYDDFSIIFDKEGKTGFMASNRPAGKGDDDIYKFFISLPEFITLSGKIIDEATRLPLKGATIYVRDELNPSKMKIAATSDDNGMYTFTAPYQQVFDIAASKKGYFEVEKTVASSPTSSFIDNVDFNLSKYDYLAKGTVREASDMSFMPGAKVTLYDETGKVIEELITDFDGYYSFGLYKGHEYRITCEVGGYALQSVICDTRNRKSTLFEHDFKMFKMEVGVTVQLDNIYYDYGKAAIRPDAAAELDKLVSILEENPTIVIELSSHTDARGSAPYNLNLSKKRAQSAVNYIISKGIVKNRLVSKGYGELKPLNKCIDGVKCTEEEYQLNRRTEFTILDI